MIGDTYYLGDLSGELNLAENQYGFEFGNNTKNVKVFWTTLENGSEPISLEIKAGTRLFGILGEEIPVSIGKTGISLSESPVYLITEKNL